MHKLSLSQLRLAAKIIAALRTLSPREASVTRDDVTVAVAELPCARWTACVNDVSFDHETWTEVDSADKALDALERAVLAEELAPPAAPQFSGVRGRSRYADRAKAGPGSPGRPTTGHDDVDIAERDNRRGW